MNLKKILTIAGYILFGMVMFLFFTYLKFPYNRLKDKIFSGIERQSGFKISAEDFKTTLLLGMVLTKVDVHHRSSDLPMISMERLKISPSLGSLILFQPRVRFHMEFKEGTLSGFLQTRGGQPQQVNLTLDGLPIQTLPFKDKMDLEVTGVLTGSASLQGNLKQPHSLRGNATVAIHKFGLGKTQFLNMALPALSLSNITLETQLEPERVIIKSLNLGGAQEDLEATLSGHIQLNERDVRRSRLDLRMRFKLSQKLRDEFSLFLPFIASALDPEGFYALKISGTLASPTANPA